MKVTILQENLARGLGIVSKAVSPRSTLPVLANILVKSQSAETAAKLTGQLARHLESQQRPGVKILGPAAARVDEAFHLVRDGPILLLGQDAVPHHDEDRGADVEVAGHYLISLARTRKSSVSAFWRSWKSTLSVVVITAPACRS